jgi:hypothetical protein
MGTDTEQAPLRSARRTGGQRHPRRILRNRPVSRVQPPHPQRPIPQRLDRSPRRPHRNAPLSCKAEGRADTVPKLSGISTRSPKPLMHKMITKRRTLSWIISIIHQKVRCFRYHVLFQRILRSARSDRPLRNVGRLISGVERTFSRPSWRAGGGIRARLGSRRRKLSPPW